MNRIFCTAQTADGSCGTATKADLHNFSLPDGWKYGIDSDGNYNLLCGEHAVVGQILADGHKAEKLMDHFPD